MPWTETDSLSFTARFEEGDEECAERTLDDLEDLRLRLEDRFDSAPGGITVILHPHSGWLSGAHPFLPAARLASAPAGRRYLAGWATRTELHTLTDSALERRAAGPDSRRALLGTSCRLYAQLVLASHNERMPPPWGPRAFSRYLRWAWLIEGGAQYYAGQYADFRAAVLRRMTEGRKPSFPPSPRDAMILGGSVFELLEEERGKAACDLLVSRLPKAGPQAALETAFDAHLRDIEPAWREHVAEIAASGPRR
ncbi:MAG: hypothetical protein U0R24_13970 [Solirubrobacterales bacterium]